VSLNYDIFINCSELLIELHYHDPYTSQESIIIRYDNQYCVVKQYDHQYSSLLSVNSTFQKDSHSCILMGINGPTGLHDHSYVIVDERIYIAVGNAVFCLSLPELSLVWSSETDNATCFGIHYSRVHRCLISHGELEISRLNMHGEIIWRTGGKDIFTGEMRIIDDRIEVEDFNDSIYSISFHDGRSRILNG